MITPEVHAAMVFAGAVAAMAEIEGMKAENMQRQMLGQSNAYDYEAFYNLIKKYRLCDSKYWKDSYCESKE